MVHDFFFSLLETSCEQDDNFPSSVCVKVNGRLQTLPNPIPTNKPGVEPKRPPKPIDITALCKLSSTVPNFVNVTWAVEVRINILKVINSTNYGCFANYQSQNITKYFPFISWSRTCSECVHVVDMKLLCTNHKFKKNPFRTEETVNVLAIVLSMYTMIDDVTEGSTQEAPIDAS